MIVNIEKKIQDTKSILTEECNPYNDSFFIWLNYYFYSQSANEKIYKTHLLTKYFRKQEQVLKNKFNSDGIFKALNISISGKFYQKDDKTYTNEISFAVIDDEISLKYPQENPQYQFFLIKKIGIEFILDGKTIDISVAQLARLCKIIVYMMKTSQATDAIMPSNVELSQYIFDNFEENSSENYDTIYSHLLAIYNEIAGAGNKDVFQKSWDETSKTAKLDPTPLYLFKTLGKWRFSDHDIKIGCDVATKNAEAEIIKGKTATQQEIDRIYRIFLRYIFTEPAFWFTVRVAGKLIGKKNPKYRYEVLPGGEIAEQ